MGRRGAPEAGAGPIEVRSPDGTPIAVWVEGEGPPLVLVHGSLCDHTRLDPLVGELRGRVATFAMDRRGFGASGDLDPYSLEREFADVAAVADAVADRAGGPVGLWGHSYGAVCAMGGAALSGRVGRLVLYEPSLGLRYPPGSIAAVERALAAGDREAAIRLAFVEILGMGEEDLAAQRASPLWPVRLASAPTMPRECRVEEGWTDREGLFRRIAAPTLVLTGSETPPDVRAAALRAADAIPGARIRTLEGHGHFAFQDDPALVAALVEEHMGA